MDESGNLPPRHGERLGTSACWDLLRGVSLGRLAVTVAALPAIVPVRFCIADGRLHLCLAPDDLPPRALDDAIVAFAADHIDPETGEGWSVQVQGRSQLHVGGPGRSACACPPDGPLAHLEPLAVAGRRLALAPPGTRS